jgi:hypothetical protein
MRSKAEGCVETLERLGQLQGLCMANAGEDLGKPVAPGPSVIQGMHPKTGEGVENVAVSGCRESRGRWTVHLIRPAGRDSISRRQA